MAAGGFLKTKIRAMNPSIINADPGDEQPEEVSPRPSESVTDEPITLAVTRDGIFPVKKISDADGN